MFVSSFGPQSRRVEANHEAAEAQVGISREPPAAIESASWNEEIAALEAKKAALEAERATAPVARSREEREDQDRTRTISEGTGQLKDLLVAVIDEIVVGISRLLEHSVHIGCSFAPTLADAVGIEPVQPG